MICTFINRKFRLIILFLAISCSFLITSLPCRLVSPPTRTASRTTPRCSTPKTPLVLITPALTLRATQFPPIPPPLRPIVSLTNLL